MALALGVFLRALTGLHHSQQFLVYLFYQLTQHWLLLFKMDDTGTTRIGKLVFNHPFFIPGTYRCDISGRIWFPLRRYDFCSLKPIFKRHCKSFTFN